MQNKYCPNDGAGLEQQGVFFVCAKCHAQWVEFKENKPAMEICNNVSPRLGLKCELPKGHEKTWKPNEGHSNGSMVWRHKDEI